MSAEMTSVARGERVLITGGTGSLGGALIPALLAAGARVRVFSRDEKKQLDVRRRWPEVECRLGDVRNSRALCLALKGIDAVIHAASLKYVDVSERQPTEYVQTNVVGTMNVIDAAEQSDTVRRVVGISTDKVPHAVNVYGLTKALLEKMFLEAHVDADRHDGEILCKFVVARYGNVVGSRGSVVPFWAEQRRKGEPLRVTDPAMTRFFFTLDDAVRLVDVALGAPSGTVVAQPMPACTLGDLARVMSRPSGDVEVVGRRAGEKTHEELLTAEEMTRTSMTMDGMFLYDPLSSVPPTELRDPHGGYTSDRARRLADAELRAMIGEWL